MSYPKKVRIIEVGPRDGLQNEKKSLDLNDKVRFIELLSETGHQVVEATSFVRPDRIPQMADAMGLFQELLNLKVDQKVNLPCLVPNKKGMEQAIATGVKEVAIFTATSNEFNLKNINATIDESFERLKVVTDMAKKHEIKVRGYVSTVFGCPYAGEIPLEMAVEVSKRLFELGVYEVSLGDTIGVGTPNQVKELAGLLKQEFGGLSPFAMHFHDTRGMAVANTLEALKSGFTSFDASAGGLGGCPYAKGATGNVATEDLIYLFDGLGIEHGVNLEKLTQASVFILEKLEKETASKFLKAYLSTHNCGI